MLSKISVLCIIMCLLFAVSSKGQQKAGTDNTKDISTPGADRLNYLIGQAGKFYFEKPDSSLYYAGQAIILARQLNNIEAEKKALNLAGEMYRTLGDFPSSLDMQFHALEINKKLGNKFGEAATLGFIGFTYTEFTEYRLALSYLQRGREIIDSLKSDIKNGQGLVNKNYNKESLGIFECFNATNTGYAYEGFGLLDSALYFQKLAEKKYEGLENGNLKSLMLTRLGSVYARMKKYDEALRCFHASLQNAYMISDKVNPSKIKCRISETYMALGQYDSSLLYAKMALKDGRIASQKLQVLDASNQLVKLFRQKNVADSIIYYQDISMGMKDSLFGPEKFRQLQLLTLREQQRQQQILKEQEQYRNRIRIIALLSLLGFFLFTALLLYRNNRHKQKANMLLQEQKQEIQETLNKLTSTQKQLVQSEKMASLGELTAGVAHEIQNPLNFVNNFSELNGELLEDLKDATKKEDLREIEKLTEQLKENESKINYHGKRADAIVKNMLQHSRNGSAQKEPTDINKLTDEYVRLSFHGMRAKDKTFNAELDLQYDPAIGKINIIPQDIGRVLLNILNNAFYAVNEKQKSGLKNYSPKITVTTSLKNNIIESIFPPDKSSLEKSVMISIADNGLGIPTNIQDKIFQPFFTTKPTGEGTGLGLSLSYDIITKGHGGELKITSIPGESTIFTIELPL